MRFIFFFQAEDGIRDHCVTGVQTCALPISRAEPPDLPPEQIRMLRFLAGLANRGIDKVPLSNLAAGTQVGLAAMKYHLAELEKRHFVYVGHHPKPRESDVRISPGGVGWLLAQDEMPGSS